MLCNTAQQAGARSMEKVVAYHLPGAWGLVSVSPFCLKLDAFLRMTGIPA
jgi:hypothetical protein